MAFGDRNGIGGAEGAPAAAPRDGEGGEPAGRRYGTEALLALVRGDGSWFARRGLALEAHGLVWRGVDRPGRVAPATGAAGPDGALLVATPFGAPDLFALVDAFPDLLLGWFNEEGALRGPRVAAASDRSGELAALMRAFGPVQAARRERSLLETLRSGGFDPGALDLASTRRGPRAVAREALVGTAVFPTGAHFRATWDALARRGTLRGATAADGDAGPRTAGG